MRRTTVPFPWGESFPTKPIRNILIVKMSIFISQGTCLSALFGKADVTGIIRNFLFVNVWTQAKRQFFLENENFFPKITIGFHGFANVVPEAQKIHWWAMQRFSIDVTQKYFWFRFSHFPNYEVNIWPLATRMRSWEKFRVGHIQLNWIAIEISTDISNFEDLVGSLNNRSHF